MNSKPFWPNGIIVTNLDFPEIAGVPFYSKKATKTIGLHQENPIGCKWVITIVIVVVPKTWGCGTPFK